MAQLLSNALRPRRLSALFGQESTIAAIRKQIASGRIPQAWMFSGPPGCGKSSLALIIAVSYQCRHQEQWGEPCTACTMERERGTIHEINAGEQRGVEEMERIVEISRARPLKGYRVIILDEIQHVSAQGFTVLLKPFENAPPFTVWIIGTTEPNKVPAAMRRRCLHFTLNTLGIQAREQFLTAAATHAKIERPLEPLFEQVHLAQEGSPGVLLMALEKYAAGASAMESVAGVNSSVETLNICKAVTAGDWKRAAALLDGATPDTARLIKASVGGWLRGFMKRETNPARLERVAASLIELNSNAPYDDAALMLWLWGTLYKVCRRFSA